MRNRNYLLPTAYCLLFLLVATSLFWQVERAEAESIIMKVLVVNPSKDRVQTVPIKTYLPQEIKSEDVLDKADFKLDYDVEKGLYYISKEIELKPAESVVYEIELRDVWVFSENELGSLKEEAGRLAERLKETIYFEEGSLLKDRIERRIEEILRKQGDAEAIDVLPQRHIAAYRENTETLKFIKTDLSTLEKLVIRSGIRAGAKTELSVKSTWKIILAIILFLAVLSVLFFIVWHMQVKQQVERSE